ncbi:hypothetical protein GAY22_05875 [Neisseria gonorrhoeae]|nr:hypothetical protein GAY22_05875 [Neisseria gonorrhoeae]
MPSERLSDGICFWVCTRLADMLPSKYEDNTLQIKERSTKRTAPFFVLERMGIST